MRLSCLAILDGIASASKHWSSTLSHFDFLTELDPDTSAPIISPDKDQAEDDLAAWLDNLDLDDEGSPRNGSKGQTKSKPKAVRGCHTNPKIVPNSVELYRCSYCRNPSASLKKCSGCGNARYVYLSLITRSLLFLIGRILVLL